MSYIFDRTFFSSSSRESTVNIISELLSLNFNVSLSGQVWKFSVNFLLTLTETCSRAASPRSDDMGTMRSQYSFIVTMMNFELTMN